MASNAASTAALLPSPQHQHAASLKLGLGLRLLEYGLHLGSLHDIALDLQLAAHEQLLCVRLAGNELGEVEVREDECDCDCIGCQLRGLCDAAWIWKSAM